MLQRLLPLLPSLNSTTALVVAAVGMLIGFGLWLSGSRFSRSIVTLAAVSLGAAIGKELPAWCGWTVDNMGTAVGGATILGIAGYLLHRFWVGVGLALVLAAWAGLGVWLASPHRGEWHAPATESKSLTFVMKNLTSNIPDSDQRALAVALAGAAAAGLTLAGLWPRLGAVSLYSLAGGSLLMGALLAAIQSRQPSWIARIPQQDWAQIMGLSLIVVTGAAVQWWLAPRRAATGGSPADPSEDKEGD